MIRFLINFFILFFLLSCKMQNIEKIKIIDDVKSKSILIKKSYEVEKENLIFEENDNIIKFIVGDPYFIEGVKYTPKENYDYNQIGLATFYNKELHNKKTINNDYNKVTELLGRHKTLPIPSVVKVTNLENGLSVIVKINDRHNDNSSIIEVSRKTAQLLKFYKAKITKVRVEILSDPSKQMKIVTKSMNEPNFNETITSAPTEIVSITDMSFDVETINKSKEETPIEIGFTEINKKDMYLRIYNFESYEKAKFVYKELELNNKFTTQKDEGSYSLIIGPLDNFEANKLVLSFISRGYKKTEFFLE